MRLVRILFVLVPMLASACAETPRCVDHGTPMRPRVVVECNAGKVAVCSTAVYDPTTGEGSYDPDTGGLVRVPPVVSGTQLGCDAYPGYPGTTYCRPLPTCGGAGQAVTCPSGAQPVCVLGEVTTLTAPTTPTPDAGMPDAGTMDDGGAMNDGGAMDDGGAVDASLDDAGASDASAPDASAPDDAATVDGAA